MQSRARARSLAVSIALAALVPACGSAPEASDATASSGEDLVKSCPYCGLPPTCGYAGQPECSGHVCYAGTLDVGGTCQSCSAFTPSNISLAPYGQGECPGCLDAAMSFSFAQQTPPMVIASIVNQQDFSRNESLTIPSSENPLPLLGLEPGDSYLPYVQAADAYGHACASQPGPAFGMQPDPTSVGGGCVTPVQFTTHGGGSMKGPATVVPLLFGFENAAYRGQLDVSYRQIEQSNWYAWLRSEYGAPALSYVYPVAYESPMNLSGGMISETTLLQTVEIGIANGTLPSPSNAVYSVHLPPGTIMTTTSGESLCGDIAGTNGAFQFSLFPRFYYTIVADPHTSCSGGYDSVTMLMSHELAEITTDPDSNGWRDDHQPSQCWGREIGDLCDGDGTWITTQERNPYTGSYNIEVQKLWSNRLNACVTEDVLGAPLE